MLGAVGKGRLRADSGLGPDGRLVLESGGLDVLFLGLVGASSLLGGVPLFVLVVGRLVKGGSAGGLARA